MTFSRLRAPVFGGRTGIVRRCAVVAFVAALTVVTVGSAQSSRVPASVQASLIAKVASFDRNFAARAGNRAVILVVRANNHSESEHDASSLKAALASIPKVGNLPHEEIIVTYTGAAALAAQVRAKRAAIVYFGAGFSDEVAAIRAEFSTLNVLTFASVPEYVPEGIVLGVDLVSGRPKLLVNLTQASKQNVSFPAAVLNLMKVHR